MVVGEETESTLAEALREDGYGVTIIDGKGKNDSSKSLLFIQLRRKQIPTAIKTIKYIAPSAYITVNDITSMFGGFIKK